MSDAMDYDPELDDVHIHLKPKNPIDHPIYYNTGNIEAIDYILDQDMDFLEGNVVKYVSRYKYKNGLEDLQKALWYLERLIERNDKE